VFCLCVANDAFDRAIVGLGHQLLRHGSVAIVAADSDERTHYTRLIGEAMAETCATTSCRTASVVAADVLEPNDTDSAVVVLRHPTTHSGTWLQVALGTAGSRAVVVTTMESAYQLLTMQNENSFPNGFVMWSRRLISDQENKS